MSTTLNLPPGTHHLKFIVDGEMRTTDHLPTAVDFTNVLVNYIEVSADDIPRTRRDSDRAVKSAVPEGVYPPQVLPEVEDRSASTTPEPETAKPIELPEEEIPTGDFRQVFPQALMNIELEETDPPAYHDATSLISDLAPPPTLPLFLTKSILNGITPIKDDSSVLNYPNHTVLNHLATSSIKNGVLATSVTTRYKRKYVTTIMYKPTLEIES